MTVSAGWREWRRRGRNIPCHGGFCASGARGSSNRANENRHPWHGSSNRANENCFPRHGSSNRSNEDCFLWHGSCNRAHENASRGERCSSRPRLRALRASEFGTPAFRPHALQGCSTDSFLPVNCALRGLPASVFVFPPFRDWPPAPLADNLRPASSAGIDRDAQVLRQGRVSQSAKGRRIRPPPPAPPPRARV